MAGVRKFGAVIIGDEIVRGKRQDKHFAKLREILAARGLYLDWVLYLGDNRPRLIDALRHSLAGEDVVFSFGGIGATPDDHTRQAAAAAAGVPLQLHPEAEEKIRARLAAMNRPATPSMLEMGAFPVGSRIIPNPFNGIPGFSYGDHHFVPGFPEMAWPMVEWVLESRYRDSFNAIQEAESAIIVWEGIEGLLRRPDASGSKGTTRGWSSSACRRSVARRRAGTSNSACAACRKRCRWRWPRSRRRSVAVACPSIENSRAKKSPGRVCRGLNSSLLGLGGGDVKLVRRPSWPSGRCRRP